MNTGTIQEFFDTMDPFEEPLEEKLILNDTYFAAARDSVTVDGMEFTFLKPPYMNFDDHIRTKRKLREAYSQHEFLLLYDYSGCGKTTVLTQFHEKKSEFCPPDPGFHLPQFRPDACENGGLPRSADEAAILGGLCAV